MAKPNIDDYLRLYHMKQHQGDYNPALPKDISDGVVDDSFKFVMEYKRGKGSNWTMADVRDALDDRIVEVFNELDECDQFTLQMSDRAPESCQEWNFVEKNG